MVHHAVAWVVVHWRQIKLGVQISWSNLYIWLGIENVKYDMFAVTIFIYSMKYGKYFETGKALATIGSNKFRS